MKCKYCGNKTRKVEVAGEVIEIKENQKAKMSEHDVYYIICNNCKNVMLEAPDYIPQEQKKKYLERIVEGRVNDT